MVIQTSVESSELLPRMIDFSGRVVVSGNDLIVLFVFVTLLYWFFARK